jgi:acyl-CoA reductase-like NAD-dependent aldehyde dehydrogenase
MGETPFRYGANLSTIVDAQELLSAIGGKTLNERQAREIAERLRDYSRTRRRKLARIFAQLGKLHCSNRTRREIAKGARLFENATADALKSIAHLKKPCVKLA